MIGLKVLVDFSSIGTVAGTIGGFEKSVKSKDYLDSLATRAHEKASFEFDSATAATANAGFLTHVYEFGVPGITKGAPKFSDPTSPGARLWVHNLAGSMGKYEVGYVFRPATAPNPRPSTRDTGVPSKFIRKISRRKYVFKNKAVVMETGMQIEISPKNGRFIFVPFRKIDPDGKTYMMWDASRLGPLTTTPGKESVGTFEGFWDTWWSNAGGRIFEADVIKNLETDFNTAVRTMSNRPGPLVPPAAAKSSVTRSVAQAEAKASAKLRTGSRRRRRRR